MEISFYQTMTLFSNNQQLTFIAFYENFELTFSGDHFPYTFKRNCYQILTYTWNFWTFLEELHE